MSRVSGGASTSGAHLTDDASSKQLVVRHTGEENAIDDLTNIDIIRAEEAHKPYVGSKESLDGLRAEYASGSAVFLAKIAQLARSYSGLRRTRGDGNCFFRSFIFGYLERLVEGGDAAEALRFAGVLQGWRSKLVSAGFQELVFEDSLDLLLQQVDAITAAGEGRMTLRGLEDNLRDDTLSNMVVMFLRMVTSAELQLRADFFTPFILGMSDDATTVEAFCRRQVEPMGEESDHIQAVALCDALGVPVRVVYLDSSSGGGPAGGGGDGVDVNSHDFQPAADGGAGGAGSIAGKLHILYRPGHYDLLYPL